MSELNATWNWTVKSAPEDRPEMEIPRGSIGKFVGNGTAVDETIPNAEDVAAAKEMQAKTKDIRVLRGVIILKPGDERT